MPDRRTASWIALVILQKRVVGLTSLALDRFVTRASRAAGLRSAVHVLVTSSGELQQLNRRFLGKDHPTDVLSFPAQPDVKPRYAGDIAISAEIAAHNARTLGHTAAEEIKVLVLHGILHLRGYDHEDDNGKMARREEKLRRELRLPAGLIERASGAKAPRQHSPGTARVNSCPPDSRPANSCSPGSRPANSGSPGSRPANSRAPDSRTLDSRPPDSRTVDSCPPGSTRPRLRDQEVSRHEERHPRRRP